ncbi:MAG: gliding motility-associated C-terminal domain-containing protein [Saprospiraceae bacterium]
MNTVNGCSNDAMVIVQQNITQPIAHAGNDTDLNCNVESMLLDGQFSSQGASYVYNWETVDGILLVDINTLQPAIGAPGIYWLAVTDVMNGCVQTDAVEISQPRPEAELQSVQPLCYGDPGALYFANVSGGRPPYQYSIDGGAAYQPRSFFTGLAAGLYEAVVLDANGCEVRIVQELEQPDSLVVAILNPENYIVYGDSLQLLVQSNYPIDSLVYIHWEDADGLSCTDCLMPIARPEESRFYKLTVSTANGCMDESLVRFVVNKEFPVYIPNAFSPDGDGNNDLFYIFARLGAVQSIREFLLYDRWGNEVYSVWDFPANDPRYGWDGTYRGQPMNPAVFVYLARIQFSDGREATFKGEVVLVR